MKARGSSECPLTSAKIERNTAKDVPSLSQTSDADFTQTLKMQKITVGSCIQNEAQGSRKPNLIPMLINLLVWINQL